MSDVEDPLDAYGVDADWRNAFAAAAPEGSALGRVVRQDRGFVQVATAQGQWLVAVRKRRTGPVVVGDWVAVVQEMVSEILPRRSLLTRHDPYLEVAQPLVANVDVVFIVCGGDRPLRTGRVQRAVTQTYDAGATPVIVLTKADISTDIAERRAELDRHLAGVELVAVSSRTGDGLDDLRGWLAHRTSVMVGESGAGKSTLLNAVLRNEVAPTGAVRDVDAKGRHTTTRRELHLLPDGGALIDTPGVRALGLWADADAVDETFPDIAELAEGCRFSNCGHETEPGCAIREAVEEGTLDADRVASWKGLVVEAAVSEQRRSEHEKRKAERRMTRIGDDAQRAKGRR